MSTPVAAQLVPEAEKYRISTGQYNQRQQQQQQYQAPSSPPIYMAVAIHPDSSEDWSTWGYPSTEATEQAALGGCAQVMGDGCEIGASWSGRAQVAVVRDVGGNLWVDGADPQRNDAKRLALVKCLEESTGCEEVAVISNGANRGEHFAGRPPQRRTFAAMCEGAQLPCDRGLRFPHTSGPDHRSVQGGEESAAGLLLDCLAGECSKIRMDQSGHRPWPRERSESRHGGDHSL
ncbi:DUF4189 domain-containing protein [Lysobacter sp. M2-1]|uniref:DUF4189 domain-containing protein n=1 Tax=Lysobacter sp. M2-1 TaxID=2916839 RepID=UPI001F55F70C|nr:DUF4189 domain-containing protein [Lysobacter sp. M2-1]